MLNNITEVVVVCVGVCKNREFNIAVFASGDCWQQILGVAIEVVKEVSVSSPKGVSRMGAQDIVEEREKRAIPRMAIKEPNVCLEKKFSVLVSRLMVSLLIKLYNIIS